MSNDANKPRANPPPPPPPPKGPEPLWFKGSVDLPKPSDPSRKPPSKKP